MPVARRRAISGRYRMRRAIKNSMQPRAAKPVRQYRFRASPDFELIAFERLSPSEQEIFQGIHKDPDGYGILQPRGSKGLSVKSVSRDLALLLYTLRETGPLPRFALDAFGEQADEIVARMVLDGILEMEAGGEMISGPAAREWVAADEDAAADGGAIGALSVRALHYAQTLKIEDSGVLSARLYDYNRIPASPYWRELLPNRAAAEKLLDIGRAASGGFRTGERWFHWHRPRSHYDESRPAYKIYVSPGMDGLRDAFQAAAAAAVESRAFSVKVGNDVYGLLRPDKIIVYCKSFADLKETAERILRRLSGCEGQGVPFSADLNGGALLSWGIDPPQDDHAVSWLASESWRIRITNLLASALVLARSSGTGEPWRFALERMRLEGVDTRTWTPRAAG